MKNKGLALIVAGPPKGEPDAGEDKWDKPSAEMADTAARKMFRAVKHDDLDAFRRAFRTVIGALVHSDGDSDDGESEDM